MAKNKIYGVRPVTEALESGRPLEKVFLRKSLQSEAFRQLFALVRERGVPYQFVPQEKLDRLVSGNHQGAVALVSLLEYQRIENIIPGLYERGEVPFVVVLDRITDVRNIGAIARTAEAAGCHALVIPMHHTAPLNADAIKTSSGALLHLPVCREESLTRTLRYLKDSGLTILAASEKGNRRYDQVDLDRPVAVVMGSEEKGISSAILKMADQRISIPMRGKVGSLNVSVAAGVILFEVVRQRMQNEGENI